MANALEGKLVYTEKEKSLEGVILKDTQIVFVGDKAIIKTHGKTFGGNLLENGNEVTINLGGVSSVLSKVGHTHDYLSINGGILGGPLTINTSLATSLTLKRNADANIGIKFEGVTSAYNKYLGVSNGILKFGSTENLNQDGYEVFHSGNLESLLTKNELTFLSKFGSEVWTTIEVKGDANTYYPVYFRFVNNSNRKAGHFGIGKHLGSKTAAYEGNHSNGSSSCSFNYLLRQAGWDGNCNQILTYGAREDYAPLVAHIELVSTHGGVVVYLRGGGTTYDIYAEAGVKSTIYLTESNLGNDTYPYIVTPKTSLSGLNRGKIGIASSFVAGSVNGITGLGGDGSSTDASRSDHTHNYSPSNHNHDSQYAPISHSNITSGNPHGVNYSNILGTIPIWNQDTTGTAANASKLGNFNAIDYYLLVEPGTYFKTNDNLNNITIPGKYGTSSTNIDASLINRPLDNNKGECIFVFDKAAKDDYGMQSFYEVVGNSLYLRNRRGGTFSDWKKVAYTDSDITGSSGSCTGNAATVTNGVYLTATQTLTNKTLTNPVIHTIVNQGYQHRLEIGRPGYDRFDFYEYGGIYNFYKCTDATGEVKTLLGKITTNGWEGNVIGNVTGNVSGSSGSCTGNAATVTNGVYTNNDQSITGLKTFVAASSQVAPFAVSGSTVVVANLNADLLDGYDSSDFQKIKQANHVYNNLSCAYNGGKHYKITFGTNASKSWNMFYMELSFRRYPNQLGGKLLVFGAHNSSGGAWTDLKAVLVGFDIPNIEIKFERTPEDAFYIIGPFNYTNLTIDKLLLGDSIINQDMTGTNISLVDSIPTTGLVDCPIYKNWTSNNFDPSLKANIASPSFSGIPTAPTADAKTNTTQIATTAFVRKEVSDLVGGAPETLDTLKEIADYLTDGNVAGSIVQQLAEKVNKAGDVMMGDLYFGGPITTQSGVSPRLVFGVESSDSCAIRGSKVGSVSYLDFMISDDSETDAFRWIGTHYINKTETTLMNLTMTYSAGTGVKGLLNLNGELIANSIKIGSNSVYYPGNCNNASSNWQTGWNINTVVDGAGSTTIPAWVLGLRSGTSIYTDGNFSNGLNGVALYNNSGGGTVSVSRIEDTQNSANGSGFIVKIETTGVASPGLGGFYQTISSRANAVFAQIFRAKIPVGYSLMNAENSQGTGSNTTWLTPKDGTGKWAWYCRLVYCGNEGSFSSGGHVYLNTNNQPSTVIWYLSSCELFDITKVSTSWTSNNFNPSDYSLATHTHNYLPLTGGTLSGLLTIAKSTVGALTIERTESANAATIQFKNSNGDLGAIGMSGIANGNLIRWTSGYSNVYSIWDSGNSGTSSFDWAAKKMTASQLELKTPTHSKISRMYTVDELGNARTIIEGANYTHSLTLKDGYNGGYDYAILSGGYTYQAGLTLKARTTADDNTVTTTSYFGTAQAYIGNSKNIVYHAGNSNKKDVSWTCSALGLSGGIFTPEGVQLFNQDSNKNIYIGSPTGGNIYLETTSYNNVFVKDGDGKIWNAGNANRSDVDWSAKSLTLAGSITGATSITTSGSIEGTTLKIGNIYLQNSDEINITGSSNALFLNYRGSKNVQVGSDTEKANLVVKGDLFISNINSKVTLPYNQTSLYFPSSNTASYGSGIGLDISGTESMGFVSKHTATTFKFISGFDPASFASGSIVNYDNANFEINQNDCKIKGNVVWHASNLSFGTGESNMSRGNHTHSFSSLTNHITAGNEFNFVPAGYNNSIHFNYKAVGQTACTVSMYYFRDGNAGFADLTAKGFIKNGSTDSYVLTGGGGHKLITDFLTSTYLGIDNNIVYGRGTLQFGQLSGAGGTGLNNSTINNPTGDWYSHIILNHANSSGYYYDIACPFHQDELFFRRLNSGTLSDWRKVWHDGNSNNASLDWNARHLRLNGLNTTGDVQLEFWRGTNASWKLLNTGGVLKFQSNYTTAAGNYYDAFTLTYSSGNAWLKGILNAIGGLQVNSNDVWHAGNSNLSTIDWTANRIITSYGTGGGVFIGTSFANSTITVTDTKTTFTHNEDTTDGNNGHGYFDFVINSKRPSTNKLIKFKVSDTVGSIFEIRSDGLASLYGNRIWDAGNSNSDTTNWDADILTANVIRSGTRDIISPKGGIYTTTASAHTGAIKIILPAAIGNTMVSMWIDVYNYYTNTSFSVHCGGYTYNNSTWSNNPFAMVYGADHQIRLGCDGSNFIIYIGELNSSWSYPQIKVRDLLLGYNPTIAKWLDSISIGFEAAGFASNITTIAHKAWTSKNFTPANYSLTSHTHDNYLGIDSNGYIDRYLRIGSSTTYTGTSDPMAIAYGKVASYSSIQILANTDGSSGDSEYIQLGAAIGNPTISTTSGFIIANTYAKANMRLDVAGGLSVIGTDPYIKFSTSLNQASRTTGCCIHNGLDGASTDNSNLRIGTWYGVGIYSTCNASLSTTYGKNSIWFDARRGTGDFTGLVTSTGFAVRGAASSDILMGDGNVINSTNMLVGEATRSYLSGSRVDIMVNGDSNTYYPVVISATGDQDIPDHFIVYRAYAETAPSDWNTASHKGALMLDFEANYGGWGGSSYDIKVNHHRWTYVTNSLCAGLRTGASYMKFVIWLRGGGASYHILSGNKKLSSNNVSIYYARTNIHNSGYEDYVEPTTQHLVDGNSVNYYRYFASGGLYDRGSRVYSVNNDNIGGGATNYAAGNHTHTFSSLTSKPTTLAGYGITDASASNHTHHFGQINSFSGSWNSGASPIRLCYADRVTNGQGYVSRTAIGMKQRDNAFDSALISVGTNDSGTTWKDFEFGSDGYFTSDYLRTKSLLASEAIIQERFDGEWVANKVRTNNGTLFYGMLTNEAKVWTEGGTDLAFATNNTERMRFDKWGGCRIQTNDYNGLPFAGHSRVGCLRVTASNYLWGFSIGLDQVGRADLQAGRYDGGGECYPLHLNPLGGSVYVGATMTKVVGDVFGVNGNATFTGYTRFQHLRVVENITDDSGFGIDIARNDAGRRCTVFNDAHPSADSLNFRISQTERLKIDLNGCHSIKWNTTSDARLKRNINPLENSLDKISKVNPVRFNFLESDSNEIGFIAQELLHVYPELVDTSGTFYSVNYTGMIPVLTKAIQELTAKVAELEYKLKQRDSESV